MWDSLIVIWPLWLMSFQLLTTTASNFALAFPLPYPFLLQIAVLGALDLLFVSLQQLSAVLRGEAQ